MLEIIIVSGITVGAAVYCYRHFRTTRNAGGGGACSGCGSCGEQKDT